MVVGVVRDVGGVFFQSHSHGFGPLGGGVVGGGDVHFDVGEVGGDGDRAAGEVERGFGVGAVGVTEPLDGGVVGGGQGGVGGERELEREVFGDAMVAGGHELGAVIGI